MKQIMMACFLMIGLLGCGSSSSDEEIQALKKENEQLKVELDACRKKLKTAPASKQVAQPGDFMQRRSRMKSDREPTGPRGSKHVSWYSSGQVKDEVEINTNEDWHGRYVSFYENGRKKEEGRYKDGKKHGTWTKWDENGKVLETLEFIDGEQK